MRLIVEDHKTHVFWPLPGGRCRFSFQMDPNCHRGATFDKDHRLVDRGQRFPELNPDTLRALLQQHAPWFNGSIDDIQWRMMVHFKQQLATSFGEIASGWQAMPPTSPRPVSSA